MEPTWEEAGSECISANISKNGAFCYSFDKNFFSVMLNIDFIHTKICSKTWLSDALPNLDKQNYCW